MVDTTHRSDDGDNFGALDFGDESYDGDYDSGSSMDFGDESGRDTGSVLDFGDEYRGDAGEPSAISALLDDEPAGPADSETELRAIDALPEDAVDAEETDAAEEEFAWELTTVTNPLETVSVTAFMDGSIHGVELSSDAASMTESELADELMVIADLASKRASSVLHTLLLEGVKAQGGDGTQGTLGDLLGSRFLDLTPTEKATQAQAEVFATRYGSQQG